MPRYYKCEFLVVDKSPENLNIDLRPRPRVNDKLKKLYHELSVKDLMINFRPINFISHVYEVAELEEKPDYEGWYRWDHLLSDIGLEVIVKNGDKSTVKVTDDRLIENINAHAIYDLFPIVTVDNHSLCDVSYYLKPTIVCDYNGNFEIKNVEEVVDDYVDLFQHINDLRTINVCLTRNQYQEYFNLDNYIAVEKLTSRFRSMNQFPGNMEKFKTHLGL